jgi:hypothetical protein
MSKLFDVFRSDDWHITGTPALDFPRHMYIRHLTPSVSSLILLAGEELHTKVLNCPEKGRITIVFGPGLPERSVDGLEIVLQFQESAITGNPKTPPVLVFFSTLYPGTYLTWSSITIDISVFAWRIGSFSLACRPGPQGEYSGDWLAINHYMIKSLIAADDQDEGYGAAPLSTRHPSGLIELEGLAIALKTVVSAPRAVRQELQKTGLNVIPTNYYSPIPSIDEITTAFEYQNTEIPFLNTMIFNETLMKQWLIDLVEYTHDFDPPFIENQELSNDKSFFWDNSEFTYSDAMAYYAMLRRLKPAKVVEIGSGFSTLVAVEALKKNGTGTIVCIEPYPRNFLLTLSGIELFSMKIQDVTTQIMNDMLNDGNVLFIDSTHTVKAGSDCLYLYLKLIPGIKKNIYIHVHDIFLPFGMPQHWLFDSHIYWTEQYLLMAWMIDNPRVSLLFGSAYHNYFNRDLLLKLMRNRHQEGGSSVWLEYCGARENAI